MAVGDLMIENWERNVWNGVFVELVAKVAMCGDANWTEELLAARLLVCAKVADRALAVYQERWGRRDFEMT